MLTVYRYAGPPFWTLSRDALERRARLARRRARRDAVLDRILADLEVTPCPATNAPTSG